MSVHVQTGSVNSTALRHTGVKSPLTPGQVAIVTITTTFLFYTGILFMVCIGEYCKYNKRRKGLGMPRKSRSRQQSNTASVTIDPEIRSSSFSQSDYTSSFQARQSASLDVRQNTSKLGSLTHSNELELGPKTDYCDTVIAEEANVAFEESLKTVTSNVDSESIAKHREKKSVVKHTGLNQYCKAIETNPTCYSEIEEDRVLIDNGEDGDPSLGMVTAGARDILEENTAPMQPLLAPQCCGFVEHGEVKDQGFVIKHQALQEETGNCDKEADQVITNQHGASEEAAGDLQTDGCHRDKLISKNSDDVTNDIIIEERDFVIHRLMSHPSDDTMDNDSEIICDNSEVRYSYRLEADV